MNQLRLVSSSPRRLAWMLLALFYAVVSFVNICQFERSSNHVTGWNIISTYQQKKSLGQSRCWKSWNDLENEPKEISNTWQLPHENATIVWTVSGGEEYRKSLGMLLQHHKDIYRDEQVVLLLLVALDRETFETACQIEGISTVFWNVPAQSYSRVADAKFGVAAYFSRQGLHQLFVELDVFCRSSPLLISKQSLGNADLAVLGHEDFQSNLNIGMYYVKPSTEATQFFELLMELLRPSLTEQHQLTENGDKLSYFDRGILQSCLQMKQKPTKIYALADTHRTTNLLLPCYNHTVQFAPISNLYISSYRPPTVYDSTICVHPLSHKPFSSLETKLATAKFLGFDPIDAIKDETRPLLKTLSGDLSITDSPDSAAFFGGDFHKSEILQRILQYPLAALIHFAKLTNRTLVLPRHVRNSNTKAYPLYALVITASIEAMEVSWRYLSISEARQLEASSTRVVSIGQTSSLEKPTSTILADCPENGIMNGSSSQNPSICSLQGGDTLVSSMFLTELNLDWKRTLDPIVEKLTWCLTPPSGPLLSFSMGPGHMELPCTER
jgi:hypothetical protein